jgi:hypothetical protein
MAQFLLMATLLTIAGIITTGVLGITAHVGTHITAALATVVLGLFSQSMTMFFFIGTGKEIKDKNAEEKKTVAGFKSRVFPAAMYAMGTIMVTFILGGGVHTGKLPVWTHWVLSIASVVMFARAYVIELQAMDENARLMEKYLKE